MGLPSSVECAEAVGKVLREFPAQPTDCIASDIGRGRQHLCTQRVQRLARAVAVTFGACGGAFPTCWRDSQVLGAHGAASHVASVGTRGRGARGARGKIAPLAGVAAGAFEYALRPCLAIDVAIAIGTNELARAARCTGAIAIGALAGAVGVLAFALDVAWSCQARKVAARASGANTVAIGAGRAAGRSFGAIGMTGWTLAVEVTRALGSTPAVSVAADAAAHGVVPRAHRVTGWSGAAEAAGRPLFTDASRPVALASRAVTRSRHEHDEGGKSDDRGCQSCAPRPEATPSQDIHARERSAAASNDQPRPNQLATGLQRYLMSGRTLVKSWLAESVWSPRRVRPWSACVARKCSASKAGRSSRFGCIVHERFSNRRDAPRTTMFGTCGLTLALLGGVLASHRAAPGGLQLGRRRRRRRCLGSQRSRRPADHRSGRHHGRAHL